MVPAIPTATKVPLPYAAPNSALPWGKGFRQCQLSSGSAEGLILTVKGFTAAEAFVLSNTEKYIVIAPLARGVPLITHETLPVVGSAELTEADKPAPLETEHEY